jgi:hypothetical protein
VKPVNTPFSAGLSCLLRSQKKETDSNVEIFLSSILVEIPTGDEVQRQITGVSFDCHPRANHGGVVAEPCRVLR